MGTNDFVYDYTVNEERCLQLEAEHKDWGNLWYSMNSTNNWGCCTYLYKKYGSPETYQAFYDSYTTNNTSDYGDKENGRTSMYILKEAVKLSNKDMDRFPLKDYYDYIVKKLIVDTLKGCKKELEVKYYLEEKGFTTTEPTYYQDTKEGIDKFVWKDDKLQFIVQVKPNTFFIGNRNESLINDRRRAVEKENICKNKYNVPVVYMIYNKQTGVFETNNKGGRGFLLKNLIDNNGISNNFFVT